MKPLDEMSVLIVDDMENMCKSIRAMLKILQVGKKIRIANNGRDGWNILKKDMIDLAIIDWNMPVMNGIELLDNIRADREIRDMPVVMITAEATKDIVAEAAESDIDAYILKPLTVKSLGDKITNVIERIQNPSPMWVHLRKARDLEENGDINAAIREIQAAMAADPRSSRPIRTMGILYYNQNQFDQAEKWFIAAAKMNRLDVFAFHFLGEIYLKKNQIDQAAKFFEKAMEISPRHVDRAIQFGKVMAQKGNTAKAKAVFDKAISIADSQMGLREEIANFAYEMGMIQYARQLYEFILQQDPKREELRRRLAFCFMALNEHGKALPIFLEIDKKEKDDVKIKLEIAKIYMVQKRQLKADEILRGIIKADPENETARSLLRENL